MVNILSETLHLVYNTGKSQGHSNGGGEGGGISALSGIYTLPKSVHVNLWGKNDVRTVIENEY